MSPLTRREFVEGGAAVALGVALPGMPAYVPTEAADLERRKAELIGLVLQLSDEDAKLALTVCQALLRWQHNADPEARWVKRTMQVLADFDLDDAP